MEGRTKKSYEWITPFRMRVIPFHPEHFSEIFRHMDAQLPVILPTDTCYGFSGSIFSEYAIGLVERIKGRTEKPFLMLVENFEQMQRFSCAPFVSPLETVEHPTTFLLPKSEAIPPHYFSNTSEVGIRIPSSFPPLIGFLHAYKNPVFSTSANKTTKPPLYLETDVIKEFGDYPELLFATAGDLPFVPPSSVVRVTAEGLAEKIR